MKKAVKTISLLVWIAYTISTLPIWVDVTVCGMTLRLSCCFIAVYLIFTEEIAAEREWRRKRKDTCDAAHGKRRKGENANAESR